MLRLMKRRVTDHDDDRGAVMIAVIGLLAVTVVITATISAATVRATGYTSLSRASVQTTAAADAGIDAMLAEITGGSCPVSAELERTYGAVDPSLTGAQAAAPFFAVEVFQRAVPSGDWRLVDKGCPSNASTQIRLVSTGFALAGGVTESSTARDSGTVEVVYEWLPGAVTAAASGAAVYSYGSPGLSNSLELLEFNGAAANLMVRDGNINCSNSVNVEGDIIAANGNIELSNSCSAEGDLWASGTVRINNSSTIGGNLIAVGTGQSALSNQARIAGDIQVGGSLSLNGNSNATMAQIVSRTGATSAAKNQPGLPLPEVPEWVDVDYVPSDWLAAGWSIQTYSGPCNIDQNGKNTPQVLAWSQYTTPTLVDMRGCTGGVIISTSANLEVNLKTDITFILPKSANLENFTVTPFLNQPRVVRFITPDTVPDQRPTTTGCGNININNRNIVRDPVSILVYSPCDVFSSNQMTWRGQFYGGRMSFSNNSEVTYIPVGIPGYDLNGGEPPVAGGVPSSTVGSLGVLQEYRDITLAG